jgi:hypothetical protein
MHSLVNITIYDMMGRVVRTLVNIGWIQINTSRRVQTDEEDGTAKITTGQTPTFELK